MKIKISLSLGIIVCFLATNKVCAQTIGLSGPTTAVTSGTLASFTITGETANKFMGSVPRYADAINNDLLVPGVTCELWETNYYVDNRVGGTFKYKLINENTVAKTVQLKFRTVIVTKAGNGSLTTTAQYFVNTVTINPTPPTIPDPVPSGLPEPPVAPGLVKVAGLFTFPSLTKPDIAFKLPDEGVELKWNQSKLSSSMVNITIYRVYTSSYPADTYDYPGTIVSQTTSVPNNGSYMPLGLNGLISLDNRYGYYAVIEDLVGNKYGRSGLFFFVNDHGSVWGNNFPNSQPYAFWIFRPDSSGSGGGELNVKWLADRIDATNVSIDLYTKDGVFFRRLINSTPNNGSFILSANNDIPLGVGTTYFYQYKITSIENPSQFGYSEVFHHWLD